MKWLRELLCVHSWSNAYEGAPFVSARVWTCSSCGKRIRHEPLPFPARPPVGQWPKQDVPSQPKPPGSFVDVAAIRARDDEAGATWFTGPNSFTAQAARDRRELLRLIGELQLRIRDLQVDNLALRPDAERYRHLLSSKDAADVALDSARGLHF